MIKNAEFDLKNVTKKEFNITEMHLINSDFKVKASSRALYMIKSLTLVDSPFVNLINRCPLLESFTYKEALVS